MVKLSNSLAEGPEGKLSETPCRTLQHSDDNHHLLNSMESHVII